MQVLAATYTQHYTPVADNIVLSALVAALPIIVLLGLLGLLRVKAHLAALAGLVASLLVAIVVFGMPVTTAAAAATNGAAFGLFPIGWIVLCAIFVYDITVKTGKFEEVRHTIAGLAVDRRIQLLLIAFSFGAFIEGAAGFGTPIAICAAMLIGLGFRPLPAAGLSLIGNTAPVAFGAIGTPLITLASVTGLPLQDLSAMVGRQLPFFSVIVPFWLVAAMAGFRRTREVWPACLTAGLSFAIVQFLVSNLHGPWLVDIIASIASILATVVLLRFWQPKETWRFDDDPPVEEERAAGRRPGGATGELSPGPGAAARSELPASSDRREAFLAWLPWILLAVLVFLWGTPQVKSFLNDLSTTLHIGTKINWPGLHLEVVRTPPVVAEDTAEKAVYEFFPLSATRLQQLGRGDGQDDRRPGHRGRRGGHRPAGPRGRHPALRVLPLHRPGLPGRRAGARPGVRVPGRGALAADETAGGPRKGPPAAPGADRGQSQRPSGVEVRHRLSRNRILPPNSSQKTSSRLRSAGCARGRRRSPRPRAPRPGAPPPRLRPRPGRSGCCGRSCCPPAATPRRGGW